jgi:hypothetical protein
MSFTSLTLTFSPLSPPITNYEKKKKLLELVPRQPPHHQNLLNHSPENQETICYWIKQKPELLLQEIRLYRFSKRTTDQFELIITAWQSQIIQKVIDLVDNAQY